MKPIISVTRCRTIVDIYCRNFDMTIVSLRSQHASISGVLVWISPRLIGAFDKHHWAVVVDIGSWTVAAAIATVNKVRRADHCRPANESPRIIGKHNALFDICIPLYLRELITISLLLDESRAPLMALLPFRLYAAASDFTIHFLRWYYLLVAWLVLVLK